MFTLKGVIKEDGFQILNQTELEFLDERDLIQVIHSWHTIEYIYT